MNASLILISVSIFIVFAVFVLRPFRSSKKDMDKVIDGWVKDMLSKDDKKDPSETKQKPNDQSRGKSKDQTRQLTRKSK